MAGKGFPGLAIVSLIALLAALGVALLIAQPWAATTVAPQLSVAPDLGVALGGSVKVASAGEPALAPARQAVGGREPTSAAGGARAEEREGGSGSQPHVAVARVVATPAPVPQGTPPTPPPSEPLPVPQPSPEPVAVPVAAPAPSPASVAAPTRDPSGPGGSPSGPSTAGGGSVGGDGAEGIEILSGDEYAFSFSFYIQPNVYRLPGEENLILQFKGAEGEGPSFGLQLWDDGSGTQRGLWASGDAMGGERFLAPVAESVWHRAVLCFKASSEGDGFYLLLLDGQPIDARAWVSLIDADSASAQLEAGLFREGEEVLGSPEIFFGPTRLGETLESVIP